MVKKQSLKKKVAWKCNNHEINKVGSFKYVSKIMTNGSTKREITERIKKCRKILPVSEGLKTGYA
jgi:hypothetical protein